MNLGVRAHDFGQLPLEELASQIARHGLTCVQLAPAKAIAEFNSAGLTPEFARTVRATFERHRIQIAVLSCYINLGDHNEAQRRSELENFKQHLRVARHFGCEFVATETGSLNSDFSRHPGNAGEEAFQIVLAGVRELAREAESVGVGVAIEPVERYVISSPSRLRRLLDETNSPNVRVILDPVNLLSPGNYRAQEEIVDEALTLLGDRLCAVHLKDFSTADGLLRELSAGRGELNLARFLRRLRERHAQVPLILENTEPAGIAGTISSVRAAALPAG
jgi:sugar phosphate isomerase/epimerase